MNGQQRLEFPVRHARVSVEKLRMREQSQAPGLGYRAAGVFQRLGWSGLLAIVILVLSSVRWAYWVVLFPSKFLYDATKSAHLPESVIWLAAVSGVLWHVATRSYGRVLKRHAALVAAVVWALASVGWSVAPQQTLEQAGALVGATVTGWFLGYVVSPPRFQRALYGGLACVLLFHLLMMSLHPDLTRSDMGWHAATAHKNVFGAYAAIAALYFSAAALSGWLHPLHAGAWCLLSLVFLALSNSATAVCGLAAGGTAMVVLSWRVFPRIGSARLPALLLAAGIGLAVFSLHHFTAQQGSAEVEGSECASVDLPCRLARLLSRDTSLTGRVEIWTDAAVLIRERPLLGQGFGGIWSLVQETRFPQLASTGWAFHAHNTYIEVLAELGVVGLLLFCGFLVRASSDSLRALRVKPDALSLFAVGLLSAQLVMNLAESYLFTDRFGLWVLTLASCLAVAHRLDPPEARLRTESLDAA